MKKYVFFILTIIMFSCQDSKENKANNTTNSSSANTTAKKKKAPTFVMLDSPSANKVKIKTADTVNVSSIEEIVTNANHNRTLILNAGKYKLEENLVYYISNDKKEIINKKQTETRSLGGQIYISGLTNFSIIGEGSEISSTNAKAPAIYIVDSNKGSFENLTIKHQSSLKGKTSVASVYISRSKDLTFRSCELGQNSGGGIKLQDTKKLTFADCKINNTTQSIIDATKSNTTVFNNLIMSNNTCKIGCCNFWGTENSLEFKNSIFKNNKSISKSGEKKRSFFSGPHMNIKFNDCIVHDNKDFDVLGIPELKFTDSSIQKF